MDGMTAKKWQSLWEKLWNHAPYLDNEQLEVLRWLVSRASEQDCQAVGKRLDALEAAVAAIQPATLVRSDELAEALRVGLDGKQVDRRLTQIEEAILRRDERESAATYEVVDLVRRVQAIEGLADKATKMADPATVAAWKAQSLTMPGLKKLDIPDGWYLTVDVDVSAPECPALSRLSSYWWQMADDGRVRMCVATARSVLPGHPEMIEPPGGPLDKRYRIA